MPSQNDLQTAILHLASAVGGEIRPRDTYDPLAEFFGLNKEDITRRTSSNANQWRVRVGFARKSLVSKGLLDGGRPGIWRITNQGKRELSRIGLTGKPFPGMSQKKETLNSKDLFEQAKDLKDGEWIEIVIEEILPQGLKEFPKDFINFVDLKETTEIRLPADGISLAPLTRVTLVGKKKSFRYDARNPSVALYVLYSNISGHKNIFLPCDNKIVFRIVKEYEKYLREICKNAKKLFTEIADSSDHKKYLMTTFFERLGLGAIPVCRSYL